jgi:hypothetical protein
MTDRDFLLGIRQALMMALDVIERKLELSPRTSELKAIAKRGHVIYNNRDGELHHSNDVAPSE